MLVSVGCVNDFVHTKNPGYSLKITILAAMETAKAS